MDAAVRRWAPTIGGGALVVVAVLLHWQAGYTYPRPWPDEAHFLTPAIALVEHGRLAVPELNAPQGIFWVPTGYYVLQAPLLLLGFDALLAGRLLSLAGVVLFAAGCGFAARRAGVHPAVAFAAAIAWICMPRVVALGNIARMEGVILGICGVCLWLVAAGRWRFALALALVAPLIHPVGVVPAVAIAAAAVLRRTPQPWTRAEQVVLAVVGVLWVGEVVHFVANADIAADHLRFQLTRKAGRPIVWRWWQWGLLVAAGAGGVTATIRWWRGPGPLLAMWIALALAGGFVLVDVVGREMWYEALGRETAVLLLGLAAATAASRIAARAGVRRAVTAVAAILLLGVAGIGVAGAVRGGWYGMRPDAGSTAEWREFTRLTLAELQRVDAGATDTQLVVVDPLSGFAHELVAQDFDRLRFVQPTPATPMDTAAADYVLVTPGAPFVTEALVQQWGDLPPALDVSSTRGTFALQLYANPDIAAVE